MTKKLQHKKKFKYIFIIFNVALLLVCANLLKNVIPFEIKSLLSPVHPLRVQYEKDLQSFNDESLVWIQVRKTDGPFLPADINKTSLAIINKIKMTKWLEDPVGPSNAKFFEIDKEGIVLKKFFDKNGLSPESAQKLQSTFWKNVIVSKDFSSFLISFRFSKNTPRSSEKKIVDELKHFLNLIKEEKPNLDYGMLGSKVASVAFYDEMIFQQVIITPLLILILGLFFYFIYRSFQIVAWSFYVLFLCYALTLVLIILNEKGLGPYSTFALMFSAIVATADLIHVWGRLNQLHGPFEERLDRAFKIAKFPCLLTSLTTAIGFFALIVNQNLPVKYFGLYCAFVCILEWAFIFYVLPSLLKAFNFHATQHNVIKPSVHQFTHRFIFKNSKRIILISALLLGWFTYNSFKIKIDDNFYTKFEDSHFLSRSIESFSKSFNFVGTIDILYQLDEKSPFDPNFLAVSEKIENEFREIKHVSKISSQKALDQEIFSSAKNITLTNDDKNTILNFMRDYGMLSGFYSEKGKTARTTLFLDSMATADLDSVLLRIDAIKEKYKDQVSFRTSGFANIRSYINSRVISDFYESFFLSFFLIFCCYYWLYRDFKISFLALLPNALPILSISGLLGFLQIPVDTNLVILVCVAFGISGDNTIHLSYNSQEFQKEGFSYKESIDRSLNLVGGALWCTSMVFLVALPVFLLGHLKLFKHLAFFLGLSFIIAFMADVILFPAIQKEWNAFRKSKD